MAPQLLEREDLEFVIAEQEAGSPLSLSVGESFTGEYLGETIVDIMEADNSVGQAHYLNFRAHGEESVYTLSANWKLSRAFLGDSPKVSVGQIVRITRMEDLPPTRSGFNAPKNYRIEVASAPSA